MTSTEKEPEVKTLLPDNEFLALREELMRHKGRRKYERFAGDDHATKIWLTEDGRILSQMPPEDYVKEILPTSMSQFKKEEAKSGFAKTVFRFAEMSGSPPHIAASVLIKFYNRFEIPKSAELPDEILQKFQCVRVDGEGNHTIMSPDEIKENIV